MSNSRDLPIDINPDSDPNDSLEPTLKKVAPKRMLFFRPMDCERQNAYIRNCAVQGMEEDDVVEVVYRQMQSKKGRNVTFCEAATSFAFFSCFTVSLYLQNVTANKPLNITTESHNENTITDATLINMLLFVTAFVAFANMLPNIGNTLRYKETQNGCRDWLTRRIGVKHTENLDRFPYNENGVDETVTYLAANNFPIDEERLEYFSSKKRR
jgi:hypothetical protein